VSKADPTPELTRLGSYAIVRKLAKGGMAELFLARSVGPEGFEKLVVLKKILPRYAENPRFVQLFLDEAKLAASLDHPHIVHVYDMGRVEGNYFFTMEFVHGQDVRTILKHASRTRHDLPLSVAVQIGRNVAAALHHAHERRHPDGTLRNIVHRDVSPSNILVSYDGAIKLADFGVAKASSSSVRTRTGALKGKVGYMSPEQARGASIDRRSDIFSLGVVLWELVTMRRLFKSENDLATIQAIINTPPAPLIDHRPEAPAELDRIVRKALEKDPAARYQNAQEVQHDLDELVREIKLEQSSIAVGNFMHELFANELAALRAAESTGVTANDFLASGGVNPDLSAPISESELSLDDPGDEVGEDGPEDEVSESTSLPARAGSIHRDEDDDDATDFGPPPTLETPGSTTVPKPPVVASAPTPSGKKKNEFEQESESFVATRLRPNPMTPPTKPAFDEGATSVASPAFTDEAPTVTAPPELVKDAFAEAAETVVAATSYPGPSPYDPTAVAFEPPAATRRPPSEPRTSPYPHAPPTPSAPPKSSIPAPLPRPGAARAQEAWSPDEDLPSPRGFRPGAPAPAQPGAQVQPDTPSPDAPLPGAEVWDVPDPSQPASSWVQPGAEPPSNWPPGAPLPGQSPPQMYPQMAPPHPMPDGSMPPGAPGWPQPGAWPPSPGAWPGQYNTPVRAPTGSEPLDPRIMSGAQMRLRSPYPVAITTHGGEDLDVDLAPHRRWLIFGGIAVVVAGLAIVLVLLFAGNGGDDLDNEVAPDAATAPSTDNSETPPLPSATPHGDVGSSGSSHATTQAKPDKAPDPAVTTPAAGSDAGSAAGSASKPVVPARPVVPAKKRVIRPVRRRRGR